MGKGLDVEPAQAIGSQEVLLVEWLLAKAELGNCDGSNFESLCGSTIARRRLQERSDGSGGLIVWDAQAQV
jgi:hypothetical protein